MEREIYNTASVEALASIEDIREQIFMLRGVQVMLDRDLASLYQVQTKVLNQAVKRNINRFPERYMFQLTVNEMDELVTNCDRLNLLKHSSSPAIVFTEQGVTQLSAILHSDVAVEISIRINDAFHAMRHFLVANAGVQNFRAGKWRFSIQRR